MVDLRTRGAFAGGTVDPDQQKNAPPCHSCHLSLSLRLGVTTKATTRSSNVQVSPDQCKGVRKCWCSKKVLRIRIIVGKSKTG